MTRTRVSVCLIAFLSLAAKLSRAGYRTESRFLPSLQHRQTTTRTFPDHPRPASSKAGILVLGRRLTVLAARGGVFSLEGLFQTQHATR
jgi:hypothetical protein